MNLLANILAMMDEVGGNLSHRVRVRMKRLMLLGLICFGRKWITSSLREGGREQMDWSGDYRVFSRGRWDGKDLFLPVMKRLIAMTSGPIFVAMDDTGVKRAGSKVKQARWLKDPLSPPFHVNLTRGLRFVNLVFLLRTGTGEGHGCRAIPIGFDLVEPVKKPGKHATDEEKKAYEKQKKEQNLSTAAVRLLQALRATLDAIGAHDRLLIVSADGSYCNRTVMRANIERTKIIARCRKDAVLCHPAEPGGRKFYGDDKFTPESIKDRVDLPWATTSMILGGIPQELSYKEVSHVLWQSGTARAPLRLIVLKPVPYKLSSHSRTQYRQPAYLLTQDLATPTSVLIQAYVDRWQIEVTHRDMKDSLGLGEAQVWSELSVPRQPAFVAASYSYILLAAHLSYGEKRGEEYEPLPRWRKRAARPSCDDLVLRLRKEIDAAQESMEALGIHRSPRASAA